MQRKRVIPLKELVEKTKGWKLLAIIDSKGDRIRQHDEVEIVIEEDSEYV